MSFRRAEFEDLAPDYEALERSDKTGKILEVIVTMKGCKDITDKNGTMYEYVSRNFSPWVGIPEDPVTGKTSFNHPYPTPEPKALVEFTESADSVFHWHFGKPI